MVLTLLLGVRELVELAVSRFERSDSVRTQLLAAAVLAESSEHQAAWKLLEAARAVAPDHDGVRRARLAVAEDWLLRGHVRGVGASFTDVVDRLEPVLAASASFDDPRTQATALALLAFAQAIRGTEASSKQDIPEQLRRAIEVDPDGALAHLLLGRYLAGRARDLEAAAPHFARGIELARDGQVDLAWARGQQIDAIRTSVGGWPSNTRPDGLRANIVLILMADDMRRHAEPVPVFEAAMMPQQRARHWESLARAHENRRLDPTVFAAVAEAISNEDHLATLEWLIEGAPAGDAGSATQWISWLGFWKARLQESLGDPEGAVETYRGVQPITALAEPLDQALVRLTGEPLRPLSDRDPWAWRAEVLRGGEPTSKLFKKALRALDRYMWAHRRGEDHSNAEALAAANAAATNLAARSVAHPPSESERALAARLALDRASLMLAAGQDAQAVEVLEQVLAASSSGEARRGDLLVSLAAARTRRAGSSTNSSSDTTMERAAASRLLVEAVEQEGYTDWARIRWFEDLQPLHADPEYAALLVRHGRVSTPSVAAGPAHGD
jgi:tetratricopeptide (TPR) repeat protein